MVEWSRRVECHIFLIYQKLTVQDFNFQLFGILRVSTLMLGGSPFLLITFYSNLSGCGVSSFPLTSKKFHLMKFQNCRHTNNHASLKLKNWVYFGFSDIDQFFWAAATLDLFLDIVATVTQTHKTIKWTWSLSPFFLTNLI